MNELLSSLNDKKDFVAFDNLIRIVKDFYKWDDICVAERKLTECGLEAHLPKRKGSGKEKLTVEDLLKLLLESEVKLPAFVAQKSSKIPPVGIEDIDAASLLAELASLRLQMKEFLKWREDLEGKMEQKKVVCETKTYAVVAANNAQKVSHGQGHSAVLQLTLQPPA